MADRETNLSATELAWRQGVCDERNITLDGKPARIFGACLKFAQIQLADGSGGIVEFSWRTVERVIDGSKNFRSN
jgi:hypothetical protein